MTVAAVAATTVSGFVLTGTASAASRTTLPGSVPPWAAAASKKGEASGTDHVGFRVYLGWRGGTAAEDLARAVSTPGNAKYGQYLTPAQFRSQFAPSSSDVSAVQQWLRSSGFTVDYTPANNHYVEAEGSVAQANAAFGTTIGTYDYKGQSLRAPDSSLSVPSTLPAVAGVVGLDDSAALIHSDRVGADASPTPVFVNADPASTYFGDTRISDEPTPHGTALPTAPDYSYAPWGYKPQQIRDAYGLDGTSDGKGVTVAIIDAYASPTIKSDVETYAARNDSAHPWKTGQFSQVVAPGTFNQPGNRAQDPQGWYGEETLDVEAVHATAPGANVVYVGSANNYQDMDAALNHVVDNKLATIVTNSYGWSGEDLPNGYIKPQYDTTVQAALEGIGIYFSSGDNGDETGGNPANFKNATPDWPASDPWVTAVGGTSLAIRSSTSGGTYGFENGWETVRKSLGANGQWSDASARYLYGSGGGTSHLFTQPSYQQGVVPGSIATANGSTPMRAVPDVSALGDPSTGFLVGQTQTFPDGTAKYSQYRIGGTSLSSPLFAGIMADAQQRAGHVLGFANPLLYSQYKSGAYRDVTAPAQVTEDQAVVRSDYVNGVDGTNGYRFTLRTFGFDGLTIHARDGYDDETGMGSPDGSAFLKAIAGK